MPTIAEQFAAFIVNLRYEQIPPEVRENIKLRTLDSCGIGLGSHTLESTRIALNLVRQMGGVAQSTVWGTGEKVPVANAALANGIMAHSFDFDDTHTPTLVHASSCVMPAAMALAEANNLSGPDFTTLAVIGYETIVRIGLAAPARFHARGFHTTSLCGTFAAAAMGARAFSLSAQQTINALGIAGSCTSGLLQCLKDGTWVKLLHPGWAGHGGIMAALLAKEGFTGPGEVFEGELGFLTAFLQGEKYALEPMVADLGRRWETLNISFKLYPSCHYTHGPLDCIYSLKETHQLKPDQIEKIECIVPEAEVPVICEPRAAKRQPTTEYGARFSLYFCLATALLEDSIGPRTFSEEKLTDERYLKLAEKIFYSVGSFPDFPKCHPGWVRVTLRNGEVLEKRVASCKGPFGEPVTGADIERKFRGNTEVALTRQQQDKIIALVNDLDQLDSLHNLLAALRLPAAN